MTEIEGATVSDPAAPPVPAPTALTWEHLLLRSGQWLTAHGAWVLHRVEPQVGLADEYAWLDTGGATVIRVDNVNGWSNDPLADLPTGHPVSPTMTETMPPALTELTGTATTGGVLALGAFRDVVVPLGGRMPTADYAAQASLRGPGITNVTVLGVVAQDETSATVRVKALALLAADSCTVVVTATHVT